jgi:hypothetical protein
MSFVSQQAVLFQLLKCSAIFHVDLSNKTAGTGTLGAVIEKNYMDLLL